MAFFRKKPTEGELELIVLRAATLTKVNEIDSRSIATSHDIAHWVSFAIDERSLKNDETSMKMASVSVQALLTEETFLNELMEYQCENFGQPIPGGFREKMLAAIEKIVGEFLSQR